MIMQDRIVGSYTRLSIRIDIRNLRRRFFVCFFIWSCMITYDIVARSYTIRQESVTDLNVWFSDLGYFKYFYYCFYITSACCEEWQKIQDTILLWTKQNQISFFDFVPCMTIMKIVQHLTIYFNVVKPRIKCLHQRIPVLWLRHLVSIANPQIILDAWNNIQNLIVVSW